MIVLKQKKYWKNRAKEKALGKRNDTVVNFVIDYSDNYDKRKNKKRC